MANDANNDRKKRWLLLSAAVVLSALLTSLGFWQLDRAGQKEALQAQFDAGEGFFEVRDFTDLPAFTRIEVHGKYLDDRQILIENIPLEGRLGYYVITPFRISLDRSLLLVNRGWLPRIDGVPPRSIDVGDDERIIRGLSGDLPKVGIRPGEAFIDKEGWPRRALYPSIEEASVALETYLQPSVLLLDREADDGFVRHWEPKLSGPATHYSYAFQWFAMALIVMGLSVWHSRRQRPGEA